MGFVIRNIELTDLPALKKFRCGNSSMDAFLKQEAYYQHILGEGITKIVITEDTEEVIGYYTIKADALKIDDPDMYEEPWSIPCVEISRLAIRSDWQGGIQGVHLGTHLLSQVIIFIKE